MGNQNNLSLDSKILFLRLSEPFTPDKLSWRPGSVTRDKQKVQAIPYIDAKHIMYRLDDTLGPFNWQTGLHVESGVTIKGLAIQHPENGEWIWRWEPGHFEAKSDYDAERIGVLGSATVGLRRVAAEWGIGRYIYFMKVPWVKAEPYGNSVRLGEIPKIATMDMYWALPYNHPAAAQKWLERYGREIMAELQ